MTLEPIFVGGPEHNGAPRPALFCDRDGTIIDNRADYVRAAAHTEPLPGAVAALRRATQAGFMIVMITNQSAVGRGIVPREVALDVHQALLSRLEAAGVPVHGTFMCPHRPDQGCFCRKPRAGMIEAALRRCAIDRSRSAVVGDAIEDMRAARAAGIGGLLVRTGRGTGHAALVAADPDLSDVRIVADLGAAVDLVRSAHLDEIDTKESGCVE